MIRAVVNCKSLKAAWISHTVGCLNYTALGLRASNLFQNSVTERPESFAELCCHGEAPAFPSNALRRVCPINTLMTRLEWLRGDS